VKEDGEYRPTDELVREIWERVVDGPLFPGANPPGAIPDLLDPRRGVFIFHLPITGHPGDNFTADVRALDSTRFELVFSYNGQRSPRRLVYELV
jgi:hypothetical protein